MSCLLDSNYSTTKLYYKLIDDKYLDRNGKIKEEYKFKLNFPEFGIVNSKIPAKKNEKFDTLLFLPPNRDRKGEGGLRTKGYFKKSYQDKPLVSIITVVYNGEKYLEETIQSVINQTYDNIEYIIIDGGSTDSTVDIIKKYENKIDYWVSELDKGIYDAMNKSVKVTNGIFINFLNAGDKFVNNDVVESIANVAQKDIKLIYGNTLFFNEKKDTIKKQISMEFTLKNITKYTTRVVCHQSMFINKNNFISYDLQYKLKGELQLYFELALQKENYIKLDKEVAIFLEDGLGTQKFYENMKERIKVIYRYSGTKGILYALPRLGLNIFNRIYKKII